MTRTTCGDGLIRIGEMCAVAPVKPIKVEDPKAGFSVFGAQTAVGAAPASFLVTTNKMFHTD